MERSLSAMSLEELWELFPISLVEPKESWAQHYQEMEALLEDLLSDVAGLRVSHIGSTAIPGILSKDIVDVLVEIDASEDIASVASMLERNGFIRMSATTTRISLNRGYTPQGFADKVYHVHVRYAGDNDEVYFRDYLNDHPEVAAAYQRLKLALWRQYEHDRDAYTEGKADFVQRYTAEARHASC